MYYFCPSLTVFFFQMSFLWLRYWKTHKKLSLMDFKNSLIRLWSLVASPSAMWSELASEQGDYRNQDFKFLLYILAIDAVCTLVGSLAHDHSVVYCVMNSIFTPACFCASVFIVFYIVQQTSLNIEGLDCRDIKSDILFRLVIYSVSLNIVLDAIHVLFPSLFFIWILDLYSFYLIWEGLGNMLNVSDEVRFRPAVYLSVMILALPFILMFLTKLLIPAAA